MKFKVHAVLTIEAEAPELAAAQARAILQDQPADVVSLDVFELNDRGLVRAGAPFRFDLAPAERGERRP